MTKERKRANKDRRDVERESDKYLIGWADGYLDCLDAVRKEFKEGK